MFDEAEYTRMATTGRGKLCVFALKHLNAAFRSDLNDVVQEALLVTWTNRADITDNTGGYLYTVIIRTAMNWREAERRHEFTTAAPEIHHHCAIDAATPETILIRAESAQQQTKAWSELRARLSSAQLRNLEEWEARDYQHENHAQELKSSRVRKAIGRLNRHPVARVQVSCKSSRAVAR